jgi:hypothetical protein
MNKRELDLEQRQLIQDINDKLDKVLVALKVKDKKKKEKK